jgi:histidyl-tRNA synthetase
MGTTIADVLRVAGLMVHVDHRGTSLKNQLGQANSLRASAAVIIGDDEIRNRIAQFKDMESGEQESVELEQVVEYILQQFGAGEEETD